MYTLDDLSADMGAQIKAIRESKSAAETDNLVKQGKAIADLGKNIVEAYKTKASVLKLMESGATPGQMRNLIASSGLAPELKETTDSSNLLEIK